MMIKILTIMIIMKMSIIVPLIMLMRNINKLENYRIFHITFYISMLNFTMHDILSADLYRKVPK